MRPKTISVFVIVHNEEKNIERCLNSVRWADEVIIVDSHSTDRTVELSEKYTHKIFQRPFIDYGDQKNFALDQVTSEWAFSIDADEKVTDGLREEILRKIQEPEACDGYLVRRQSFILGREFHYTGTQDDKQIRLFKKEKAHFEQPIHEIVRINGCIGTLKHHLLHYPYRRVSDYLARFDRYTSMEAAYLKRLNHEVSLFDLFLKPFLVFCKLYLLKQGFRDGLEGLFFSWFSGCYVFVKYVKYIELTKREGDSGGCALG